MPTKRVRCPVHGFIRFSPAEQTIVDHPIFQRLRHIGQLALTQYVYPSAMHTRFEHSLGVLELATQAFDSLVLRYADLLEENFKQLQTFADAPLAKARQLVRLMALLHDIGHPAFSHSGEVIMPEQQRHEVLSAWAVSQQGPLGSLLDQRFFPGIAELLRVMLLDKPSDIPPQLLVLKQIISGQLDIDRMDYLLRDSLHCGVEYGRFDHLRLINSLAIHPSPDTQSLAIGVEFGGVHAFEAMLLARYYMTTQVYYHRVRRAYDLLLAKWLELWGRERYDPVEKVLDYDDIVLLAQMKRDASSDEHPERKRWAQRILNRQHPRMIWERGDHADGRDLRHAEKVHHQLTQTFTDAEFFLDTSATLNIHKFFIPGEEEVVDDLFIVDKSTPETSITERSKIIEKIPKKAWTIRIFAYFRDEDERRAATKLANEIGR